MTTNTEPSLPYSEDIESLAQKDKEYLDIAYRFSNIRASAPASSDHMPSYHGGLYPGHISQMIHFSVQNLEKITTTHVLFRKAATKAEDYQAFETLIPTLHAQLERQIEATLPDYQKNIEDCTFRHGFPIIAYWWYGITYESCSTANAQHAQYLEALNHYTPEQLLEMAAHVQIAETIT